MSRSKPKPIPLPSSPLKGEEEFSEIASSLSGGILAGGEGRRFAGADKGWLSFRGRPFITHVLERLAPQVDEVAISANRHLTEYAALGRPVVEDTLGRGPLAGLLRLFETTSHPWLLCVPCDAVLLPADLGHRFVRAQRAHKADIVVARADGRFHPVWCLVRRELVDDLRAFLQSGGRAVWSWQARHRVVDTEIGRPLVNLNDAGTCARYESIA